MLRLVMVSVVVALVGYGWHGGLSGVVFGVGAYWLGVIYEGARLEAK